MECVSPVGPGQVSGRVAALRSHTRHHTPPVPGKSVRAETNSWAAILLVSLLDRDFLEFPARQRLTCIHCSVDVCVGFCYGSRIG